ncbi:aldehyde dehydrogenase family protein [Natronolimnohabitans innermongolicus]|uniref:Aldehyde dehydrogenase n=1 Tax=Natronolimnohabitans innermongolicus JCM 12255 TaxID=1227499 RepID=L9WRD2_9EURY|nr:aldehyde dehydrogenase family protein [Natronolimnohabitans innermongolicus]ELY50883.1 aldehyde dehydrogenase [Natronolimnohabitans innermongolicus JCM 12255]
MSLEHDPDTDARTESEPEFTIDADWNGLYIDGDWRASSDSETIEVTNPATRDVVSEVPAATVDDVDDAYAAAVAAQENWQEELPQERGDVIETVQRLIEDNHEELTELLAIESGSARPKASREFTSTGEMMRDVVTYPFRMTGDHSQSKIAHKENIVKREPIGVVTVISPWNFPFQLSLRAVAPAIALGNAVVLKPASETPISGGLLIARLFEKAGLPDGVLNVVTGHGSEIGDHVASHSDLSAVAFTGSTHVGQRVAKNAAEQLALPAMELGGNNPHVVLDDADVEAAVDAGIFGSFMHQGQICISINRHLVHESIYDEYVDRFVERAAQLPVGDPLEEETVVGPIISESERDTILEYVDQSVAEGATLEHGGTAEGLLVEPTVLSDMRNDMAAACNEHFGPVAPIIPFETDAEAVELANATEYGLAGSVHSSDVARARDVADEIEAGMVHINDQPINNEPHVPFGGTKASGMGRYNGEWIIDEFTEPKWTSIQHEPREYSF